MKVYKKEVPSIFIELTESEAKALAAIIGNMGEKELDEVEKNACEDDFVNALKEQRRSNLDFAYDFYQQFYHLLNK